MLHAHAHFSFLRSRFTRSSPARAFGRASWRGLGSTHPRTKTPPSCRSLAARYASSRNPSLCPRAPPYVHDRWRYTTETRHGTIFRYAFGAEHGQLGPEEAFVKFVEETHGKGAPPPSLRICGRRYLTGAGCCGWAERLRRRSAGLISQGVGRFPVRGLWRGVYRSPPGRWSTRTYGCTRSGSFLGMCLGRRCRDRGERCVCGTVAVNSTDVENNNHSISLGRGSSYWERGKKWRIWCLLHPTEPPTSPQPSPRPARF